MNRGNLTTKDAIQNYSETLADSKKMLKKMRNKDFDFNLERNQHEIDSAFYILIYVSNLMLIATTELGNIEDEKYKIEDKKNKVVITTMDKSRSDEIWHHSGAVVATTMEGNNE